MKTKLSILVAGMLLATASTGFCQPIITVQPLAQTNLLGTAATFTVSATGVEPLHYQWQRSTGSSFSDLTDQTNDTVVLPSVQLADAGDYRVVVTDANGMTSSDLAHLYVVVPPSILTQPTNFAAVVVGSTTGNRAAATGTWPLSYRWWLNGEPLPDKTNTWFTITNVQLEHAGDYHLIVTNSWGSVTSRVVTLIVQPAQFEDVTVKAGVTNAPGYCISAAWGDYDNDQFIDLYLAIGADMSRTNALYRNNRNGTFTRVGSQAGPITTDSRNSFGCAWLDFNNDGFRDTFVVNGGWSPARNDLYWNNGDGTFRSGNAGNLTGLSQVRGWSAFADFDGDGWVDIFAIEGSSESGPFATRLYHATGTGTFTSTNLGPTLAYANDAVWGDYDNDGDPDLFICAYTSASTLWRNDGSGHFTANNSGLPSSAGTLHASWADYDRDGDLDIALSSFSDTRLYRNDGANFALAATLPAVAASAWADYDNDGYLDLLVVGGQNTPRKASLYHNDGNGSFNRAVDVFTEVANNSLSCPWGDFDNDGFMDVILTHQYSQHRLYRNLGKSIGNTNHWLKFKLIGTASNRDAIGAKIRVQATIGGQSVWQMQEVNGGYQWQNDTRLHFGLGDATVVDKVVVEWPSGNVQELASVARDQILTVTEVVGITPVRPTASLGGSVALTSQRSGTRQWYHEGVILEGQTSSTLSITDIQLSDGGRYSVVTDSGGIFCTNFVYLLVDKQFTKINEGPVVTDNEDSWGSVWVDYDVDGDVDLFVANGLFVGNQRNALYRNDGNGNFTRMTTATAGAIASEAGNWGQASWADFDNDGLPDAVVNGYETALYRNLGQGMFERRLDLVPTSYPFGPGPYFADFDNDGWVDWFVGSAVSASPIRHNSLFRNEHGRAITLGLTNGPIVADVLANTEGSAWGDYDGDGDLDLLVALGDARRVRLYENVGRGSFRRAQTVGLEEDLGGYTVTAAWGDYDNDERIDVFVSVYTTSGVLFHNEGGGVFTQRRLGGTGPNCHPTWADFDNDGWQDLFLSRGQGTAKASQLWRNNSDGTFTELTTGSLVTDLGWSQGAAWGDYDNDGFMDLFVARGYANGQNALYHNSGNSNRWLKVKLEGTTSNRSAIGAKVKVRATINGKSFWQMREVPGGNRCQDDLRANFGLGNATAAQVVRIEWPSGISEQFANLPARQILTIVEPSLKGSLALDGKFHVAMTMSTNRVYQLQASGDLVNWTTLTNCTGSGSCEPIEYVDPEAPTAGAARFYRMK